MLYVQFSDIEKIFGDSLIISQGIYVDNVVEAKNKVEAETLKIAVPSYRNLSKKELPQIKLSGFDVDLDSSYLSSGHFYALIPSQSLQCSYLPSLLPSLIAFCKENPNHVLVKKIEDKVNHLKAWL